MYQKDEVESSEGYDVNLTSKDMEVNFSNKQEDDDELDAKITPSDFGGKDIDFGQKQDTLDMIEESDLTGPVAGVPEDIKIMDKVKILEEQKVDMKKGGLA